MSIDEELARLGMHYVSAGYHSRCHEVQRLALGDLMPISRREAFPQDDESQTGTIGFIDYVLRDFPIPTAQGLRERSVLLVLVTGIEPQYRRRGYMRRLKRHMEDMAREMDVEAVVMHSSNSVSQQMNASLGYSSYLFGDAMVKKLR